MEEQSSVDTIRSKAGEAEVGDLVHDVGEQREGSSGVRNTNGSLGGQVRGSRNKANGEEMTGRSRVRIAVGRTLTGGLAEVGRADGRKSKVVLL